MNQEQNSGVAKIGQQMPGPQLLASSVWRNQVKRLAYWMLMAVIGLTVWPVLVYLLLRLS